MDRQVVKVYVRAGSHEGERTLSFRPPKEIPQGEWLRRGFAIDGNSVIASVTALTRIAPGPPADEDEFVIVIDDDEDEQASRGTTQDYPKGGGVLLHDPKLYVDPKRAREAEFVPRTLVMALQEVETWLVDWLGTLGYAVEFA